MKIGILTFHREINDGSVLQAFCLQQFLSEQLPGDHIEIIDYMPQHVRRKRRWFRLAKRPPFYAFNRSKYYKKKSLDAILKQKLKLSNPLKLSDDCQEALQALEAKGYDAIIVGSDTVWDTRPNAGAPQAPNLFFLPGMNAAKKIAFAASMDKGGPRHVSRPVWQELIQYMNNFDYISVRDQATLQYLKDSGIKEERLNFMPDPTLLYDFSDIAAPPAEFAAKAEKLAGVAVSSHKLKQEATAQLISQGYTVINLLGAAIDTQIETNPTWTYGQRLGVYASLSYMVTDRFHGSILTLKQTDSPVMLVEPDYFYPEKNSKGRDLFNRLGLGAMVWRYESEKPAPDDLIESFREQSIKIDWSDKSAQKSLALYARRKMAEIKSILHPRAGS
ncbi:MAG: polysaccharide pyruvyl transferase family protein [Desulfobacteraceae bacterium]|nr:polysaccharide pyruvyl transferase family protein [Desulfobacteraceae bacterium]